MKNILIATSLLLLLSISGCYDELDKTEAFEPFTRLTISPEGGDFTELTRTEDGALIETAEVSVEISAPELTTATVTATGGGDPIDLGTLTFASGTATLTVPVSTLNGADRIDFTAENTDGRPFTTRYSITY